MSKQRKKHGTGNINININFKLESKQQPVGKKISQQKEVSKNIETMRPTIQNNNRKKYSNTETNPTKQSIQEYLEEKTINHERDETHSNLPVREKQELARKGSKLTSRKRAKSKSLGNLKVKYYARTPEPVSRSNSKMTSKSKSKSKINSKSRSKSKKQKSDKKVSPRSLLHSEKKKTRSKSKSKSPLISTTKSIRTFKCKGEVSSRELERDKSREKRGEKHINTTKKSQPSQPSFDRGIKPIPVPVKKSTDLGQKSKLRKSKQKLKPIQPPKKYKLTYSVPQKPRPKKPKKLKISKIFSQPFLDSMAIKIQSCWRGYMVRKQFRNDLNQITNKITSIKDGITLKKSQFWQTHSNHSIIQLQSQSANSTEKYMKNSSERSNSESMNPMFMVELQKLRKKLEQQEDRFKMLAEQNNELKVNLSKVSQEDKSEQKKRPQKALLLMNHKVVSMRIQSEESEADNQRMQERNTEVSRRRKEKMLELPSAIKTEEHKEENDFTGLKKKLEIFECSPKNQDVNLFKFNKTIIKKLFSKQEQKLNQKYFKKSCEFKDLLQNQLVSPKSYNLRCSELDFKLKIQRQQTFNKYRQAEKALLLIAELQKEEQNSADRQQQNEHQNMNKSSPQSGNSLSSLPYPQLRNKNHAYDSPQGKTMNLLINVDQLDQNAEKYPPIITHNSYRQHQLERSRQEDLSELYNQVMDEQQKSSPLNIKADFVHDGRREEDQAGALMDNNVEIAQYPEFQLSGAMKPDEQRMNGFETSLKYIRLFYIKFCQFFRQIPSFREEILQNISTETTFDQQLYLHSFHVLAQEQDPQTSELVFPYFKFLATYNTAIPVHILNSYYSELTNQDSSLYSKETYQLKASSKEEYQQLGFSSYELKQYFDLALIDAFNQAINFERPGGFDASNLDELTHHYRSVCKTRVQQRLSPLLEEQARQQNLNHLLGNTIGRIINIWACSLCGFINDCSDNSEDNIDESKVEQIRMHRLSLMLEKGLVQDEDTNTNLHPFCLHTKIQLQNRVISVLVGELAEEIEAMRRME